MQLNIQGDGEKLIQASLSSGLFHTAEEAVTAMARAWSQTKATIPAFPANTDIQKLTTQQAIRPFNAAAPQPTFWPVEESTDEFLTFLQDVRQADARPE